MENKEIKIRNANEGDYEVVNLLYHETYNLYYKNIPSDYKKTPKKTLPKGTFINMIEDKDSFVTVSEINNKVIGMLYAVIEKDEGNKWTQPYKRVSIEEISVFPEFINHGIGKRLMKEAEGWAKEKGTNDLIVLVYNFNKSAISFYEKNGYKPYSIQMKKKIKE